jgi:hemoglobin
MKPTEPHEPGSSIRDLEEEDLHDLLVAFYAALDRDPLVGPYFDAVDMAEHLPRIVDFWSTALFQTRRYAGNAFLPHQRLTGLTSEHFARWIATLEEVLDERFRGPSADRMKSTAHRIAYGMQLRLGMAPFAPYTAGGAR